MSFIFDLIIDFFVDLLRPRSKKEKQKADEFLEEIGISFEDEDDSKN